MAPNPLQALIDAERLATELALEKSDTDPGNIVSIPGDEWNELADAADEYASALEEGVRQVGRLCRRNYYGDTVEGEDVHRLVAAIIRGDHDSFRSDLRAHAAFMRQYAQACRDADRVLREADR